MSTLLLSSLCVAGEEQAAERGCRDVRMCLLCAAVLRAGGEAPCRGQQAGDSWAGAWRARTLSGQTSATQGQDGSARCLLCLAPDSVISILSLNRSVSVAVSTMSGIG